MSAKKIYAIGNAHLDPVWLWSRASGRNSMINTFRSAVTLMKEFPEVKFTCSSSDMYRWCEENDPELFEEVKSLIREQRWEPVGGWEVQSDSIITRLDVLFRQADFGQEYFHSRFGMTSKIGYSVDSFGHTQMLPSILNQHGFTYYVFGRGQQEVSGTFRWIAPDGKSVIAHKILGGYSIPEFFTREAFFDRIRTIYENGEELQPFFYGIGDHGGGLYRTHLNWIREAQQEFPIQFATLSEYFDDLEKSEPELPEFSGEIAPSFCGVYSSCHTIKEQTARTIRHLQKAERMGAPAKTLEHAWREVAFNHFHDIFPGTSIRKAFVEDTASSLGAADFTATEYLDRQLQRSESAADLSFVTEGGFQIWNPHPFAVKVPVGMEAFADPNHTGTEFCSLEDANGNRIPLQSLPAPSTYGPQLSPWGKLSAMVELPANGERFFAFSRTPADDKKNLGTERQREFLKRLSFPVYFDNNGCWGFKMEAYGHVIDEMELVSAETFADGPVCSILKAEYKYKNSELLAELYAWKDLPEIGIRITVDWQEKFSCLKLSVKSESSPIRFFTGNPGSITTRITMSGKEWHGMRDPSGCWMKGPSEIRETPFNDFCGLESLSHISALISPDLHSCDFYNDQLRVTLLRPVRPADHTIFPAFKREGWWDLGISTINLWYLEHPRTEFSDSELPRRASALLLTPEIRQITGHAKRCVSSDPRPETPDLTQNRIIAVDSVSREKITLWNPSETVQNFYCNNKEYSIPPKEILRFEP